MLRSPDTRSGEKTPLLVFILYNFAADAWLPDRPAQAYLSVHLSGWESAEG